jgi:hypothetical protein
MARGGLEAMAAVRQALGILEGALVPGHADVAETLVRLASLRKEQGGIADVATLLERALAMRERTLPADHAKLTEIRTTIDALRAEM